MVGSKSTVAFTPNISANPIPPDMPATSPRVNVAPDVIKWAIDYSRREDYLRGKYPKLADWESGSVRPTMKQLQAFANDARVAEGWLYCSEPPDLNPEVPDMRTVGDKPIDKPSPDLVDTIFACQGRHFWFVEYAETNGLPELPFVGSFSVADSADDAAEDMRRVLGASVEHRSAITRQEYRKSLVGKIEGAGVLVMINGVVGNDTSRPLDTAEFRGFALSDPLAPVVFVNSKDSVGAQLFTLAHELAHIWLGESAISAPDGTADPSHESERWCNAAAAEFLVPLQELRQTLGGSDPIASLGRLSRHFKVSDQVLLRRLREARVINSSTFQREYSKAVERARQATTKATGGGNYYANVLTRVSRKFAERLYWSAKCGSTLCRDAYRLVGVKGGDQFDKLGEHMGMKF